jgi:pilus assembly protein CpaC
MPQLLNYMCFALTLLPRIASAEATPLTLYVGEARVLNETDIKRMAVGNGKVISTNIINTSQLLLLAETQGQSTVHLWHRDGTENDYSVTVVSADAARLLTEVRSLVGNDPKVTSRIVGDKVILEGSDLGNEQTSRVADITKLYPQIVNLVSHVTLERMVEIDVRIMEFRKTSLTQLGITWSTTGISGPTFGIVGDVARGSAFRSPPSGTGLASVPGISVGPTITPFSTYLGIASSITSAIDAAVTKGDATYLSEPKLTCKSGGSAKFLSGGEVPIPISSFFGTSVQFKPYGVKLEVDPVVAESGLIHLKAFTELSAIDPTVTVAGIPGFLTRRTDTEVNLQSEQTLVISGLFDGTDTRTITKVPGLGDIPVLGELFKSRDFQKKKSDLVIFLTPHLITADSQSNVDAVKAGEDTRRDALKRTKLAE